MSLTTELIINSEGKYSEEDYNKAIELYNREKVIYESSCKLLLSELEDIQNS